MHFSFKNFNLILIFRLLRIRSSGIISSSRVKEREISDMILNHGTYAEKIFIDSNLIEVNLYQVSFVVTILLFGIILALIVLFVEIHLKRIIKFCKTK